MGILHKEITQSGGQKRRNEDTNFEMSSQHNRQITPGVNDAGRKLHFSNVTGASTSNQRASRENLTTDKGVIGNVMCLINTSMIYCSCLILSTLLLKITCDKYQTHSESWQRATQLSFRS